jgi:exopolysaccharide biosynthesis polyprenyl glycosylphosphotransferase
MMRLRHKLFLQAFRGVDQLVLYVAFASIYRVLGGQRAGQELSSLLQSSFTGREIASVVVLGLGWYFVFASCIRYETNRFTTLAHQLGSLLQATTLAAAVLFVVAVVFGLGHVSDIIILYFWIATSVLGIATRVLLRFMLRRARKTGMNRRHIVIAGTNEESIEFATRLMAHPELGFGLRGFLAEKPGAESLMLAGRKVKVLGSLRDIQAVLEHQIVDEVMVCLPLLDHFEDICRIVKLCRDRGVVVRIESDLLDAKLFAGAEVETFEGRPVVTFFRQRRLGQLALKRVLDIVASSVLLLVLSPVFLIIAAAIRIESPGPVMFAQERIGMNRRRFRLLKFRSMVVDAEAKKAALASQNEMGGPVFKMKNDPRVTRVGRFIRRTSMDELPQLVNVLKGEMSLVGPRPPLVSEVERYDWVHRKRISIKPGITCLWQISGRNNIPFERWMEMDRQYVENWCLWLDVKILCKTVPVVILGSGAC